LKSIRFVINSLNSVFLASGILHSLGLTINIALLWTRTKTIIILDFLEVIEENISRRLEVMLNRSQGRRMVVLRKMLETQGLHFTRQRAAVFDYLSRVNHHPTAEEVFFAVKQELPKISLATVYKNLEALVACGAVSKLIYGDAAVRYDIRTDHHYHSRCLKCGRITDLEPEAKQQVLKLVKPPRGFKVEDYRVDILGYCSGCR
jgi:Fur family transcriptional regulator, peroxide stress response regulator